VPGPALALPGGVSAATRSRGPAGPGEVRETTPGRSLRGRQAAHPGSALPLLVALLLPPAARAESTIEFEGGPIVLGRAPQAAALVRVEEEEKALPLRLAASAGSFGEAERVKRGLWKLAYTPPATRFPQVVIAALWREGGPLQVEFIRFPLHGVAKLPVKASPGYQVTVEVAGRSFGPVTAGEGGQAVVAVVVPPDAEEAVVSARGQVARTLRTVRLEKPDGVRLLAVALRPPGAAGPRVPARLLVAYDPISSEFSPSRLQVSATAGEVAYEKSSGRIHAFRWTPPERLAEQEVSFSVAVEGDAAARATARLSLVPPARTKKDAAPATGTAPRPTPVRAAAAATRPVPLPPPPAASAPVAPRAEPAPAPSLLLAGARAGFTDDFAAFLGPRAGLELWASLPPRWIPWGLPLGLGLGVMAGSATRPASAAGGEAHLSYLPLTLRLAWEARLGRSLVARIGAGGVAAWLRARTPSAQGSAFAAGGLAFASAALPVGRAELFAELSVGSAPATTVAGRVNAAGLAGELGLRVAVF